MVSLPFSPSSWLTSLFKSGWWCFRRGVVHNLTSNPECSLDSEVRQHISSYFCCCCYCLWWMFCFTKQNICHTMKVKWVVCKCCFMLTWELSFVCISFHRLNKYLFKIWRNRTVLPCKCITHYVSNPFVIRLVWAKKLTAHPISLTQSLFVFSFPKNTPNWIWNLYYS